MAGTRITQFPLLPSGDLAADDVLLVVDVSDTFYSPSGTNKQTTIGDLANATVTDVGATTFIGLTDTAGSLGAAGQSVVVSPDGNSLAFSGITTEAGSSTFADLTDTVSSLGSEGQVVVVSGTTLAFSGISASASAFSDLTDTPGSLGSAGQSVVVSSDGNSLTFSGVTGGGGTASAFPDLTDTPAGLGSEGQVVVVSGSSLAFSGITLTSTTVASGTFSEFTQLIDTPSSIEDGKLLIGSGTGLAFSGLDSLVTIGQTGSFGGVSDFTGLSDTPSGLGSPLQSVVVSADGNSLIFSGITGGGGGTGPTGPTGPAGPTGPTGPAGAGGGATTSNSGILGSDLFTGDGVTTGFMMTRAPINDFSITVAVNGLLQTPGNNYDLVSGKSGLAFPEAPSSGIEIDVRHLGGLVGPSGEQGPQGIQGESTGVVGALASDIFTGDGSTVNYNLTNSIGEAKNTIVSVNGLLQSPITNYTISGSGLTFPEAPSSGLEIEVRHLAGIRGPSGEAGADGTSEGAAKAWVNFIGVTGGNATITDNLNVDSVSRITVGVYTVNFGDHFDDTNYIFTAGGYQNEGGYAVMPVRDITGATSVSGCQIAIVSGQSRIDSTGQGVYLSFLGT